MSSAHKSGSPARRGPEQPLRLSSKRYVPFGKFLPRSGPVPLGPRKLWGDLCGSSPLGSLGFQVVAASLRSPRIRRRECRQELPRPGASPTRGTDTRGRSAAARAVYLAGPHPSSRGAARRARRDWTTGLSISGDFPRGGAARPPALPRPSPFPGAGGVPPGPLPRHPVPGASPEPVLGAERGRCPSRPSPSGELLEESQMEASRLRQKAEALVQDSELGKDRQLLPPPSPTLTSFDHLPELTGKDANVPAPPADPAPPSDKPEPVQKPPSSGTSSEFEVVPNEQNSPPESGGQTRNMMELGPLPHEDSNLMLHLQRLETTLSVCAEEPDHSQLFTHLGRMALEFNRLASKVHKNEQRTSILQTLCEQLRKENETLKAKLDKGLEQRDQAAERLREENMELKKLLMTSGKEGVCRRPGSPKMEGAGKKGVAGQPQASATASKIPEAGALGAAEKKVKMLEQQRTELLEVNKQWDQHFRSMKQQYEQKITELRQKLADLQKQVTDLEAEREQKQRDFDRKLLLAKSKIEMEETDKEQLSAEAKELRQKVRYLQDQLSPLTRQRDYQEKEIQRLNKALEEALSIQASPSSPPTAFGNPEGAGGLLRKQELVTQNELLKQQVKIFEEDFQRERSDRERMNEEKEELKKQVEKLQAQVTLSNAQLKAFKDEEKAKEALKQQKRKAKASAERYHVEPHPYFGYYGPPVPHHGYEEWSQIRYPPPPMAMEHPPPLPNSHLYPMPGYTWRPPYGGMRNQTSQVMDSPTARPAEPDSAKNDRKGPQ